MSRAPAPPRLRGPAAPLRHPLLLVGGALVAGYVAGGGLAARVVGGRILRMGAVLAWRFVVLPALEERLRGAIDSARTARR